VVQKCNFMLIMSNSPYLISSYVLTSHKQREYALIYFAMDINILSISYLPVHNSTQLLLFCRWQRLLWEVTIQGYPRWAREAPGLYFVTQTYLVLFMPPLHTTVNRQPTACKTLPLMTPEVRHDFPTYNNHVPPGLNCRNYNLHHSLVRKDMCMV